MPLVLLFNYLASLVVTTNQINSLTHIFQANFQKQKTVTNLVCDSYQNNDCFLFFTT